MTLRSVLRLVGRYWYVVLAVTVIATCASAAIVLCEPPAAVSHSATSRIIVNSQLNSVRGIATSEAREFNNLKNGYSSSVSANGDTWTIAIAVTGPDGNQCIQYANEIAQKVEPQAKAFFAESQLPMELRIEEAVAASESQKQVDYSPIWVAALIALGAGVVIVTIIGKVRRPIMDVEGVQGATNLPVLEALPVADGKRLLANVRFASKNDDVSTVFVIPVKSDRATGAVCDLLNDDLDVTQCKPLTTDLDKLYDARKADAVLVSVEKWKDTIPALKSTVAELRIAGVNLVGLVFVRRNKRS